MVEQNSKNTPNTPEPAKSIDTFFEERAVADDNQSFTACRSSLFLRAVLLSVLLIVGLYLFSPESRVKAISVRGNNYLSGKYVASLSGISVNDLLYAQFPGAVAARVQRDPLIEKADVRLLRNNLIEITITEKQPIGCRYDTEVPTILCTDGTVCELTSDYMSLLSRIPYITGFNENNATHLLTSGFKDVDPQVIEAMAEVIQYPLSYDDEAVEIRMRDGGVFFGNYFSLGLINNYDTISALMTNKNLCVYADNGTTVAAARACPWDEVETILDYWTTEDGNYIYNKWGDRAVKHYYSDKNGNFYLDDNGNKILIPIDAYGQDDKDPDFLNHYFGGWYKNGYLQEPEETDEDSQDEADKPEEESEQNTEDSTETQTGEQTETEAPAETTTSGTTEAVG